MLIQSPLSFSSSSISYYSPNALKTIIAAFNWNDWDNPDAHPEYPAAYKRYFTQANYKYLPHYILLNVEQSYSSFATQLGKYKNIIAHMTHHYYMMQVPYWVNQLKLVNINIK